MLQFAALMNGHVLSIDQLLLNGHPLLGCHCTPVVNFMASEDKE
jgi:hypothetical protein